MTLTGFNRSARLTSAAAVLAVAGVGIAPSAAHAAVTLDPTNVLAGQAFKAGVDSLQAGAQYRVLLTSTGATDRTNVAESNSCATLTTVSGTTLSCAITENTAGSYELKVVNASDQVVQTQAVTVGTPIGTTTAPVVDDRAGTANDTLTFTYTPGVVWTYTPQGGSPTTVDFGTNPTAGATKTVAVTGDVTYAATAAPGYGFTGTAPSGTLRLTSADPIAAPVSIPTASQPVKVDQVGIADDKVTLTQVPHVTWNIVTVDKVSGKETSAPVTFGSGSTVTAPINLTSTDNLTVYAEAVADAGYAFSGGRIAQRFDLTYTNDKAEPAVTRLTGDTRFDTAVEIAKKYFPGQENTVYVANGMRFADALAAGPAAANDGAPLLLTAQNSVQANVLAEIGRMKPTAIKVVGGADVVSSAVVAELEKIAPVTRIEGADRFATAAKVSSSRSAGGTVYIANGLNFPDALSGGSGAAREGASLLLTDGKTLSDDTVVELRRLKPSKVVLVGGTNVVTSAVARQVGDILGSSVAIDRAAGKDRFETSALIVENVTGKAVGGNLPGTAFLATGLNFPDALAGIPAAHVSNAPLALVLPTCQPASVKAQLDKLPLTETVRLGSTNVVGDFSMLAAGC